VLRKFNLLHGEVPAEEEEHRRPGYMGRWKAVDDEIGAALIGGAVMVLGEDERICPYHYHHGVEEWLYVIDGTPTVRRPDGETPLRAGDVVCFPAGPEGAHTVRGPGRILMLSREIWPAVVVYPDSDKIGARPGPWGAHNEDRLNFRRETAVDYWDGEQ
jgi:uncharacterized cupin superfamily protein